MTMMLTHDGQRLRYSGETDRRCAEKGGPGGRALDSGKVAGMRAA